MTDQTLNGTDSEQSRHVKGVVEALLFVNEKPVTLEQIKRVLGAPGVAEIKDTVQALIEEYGQRQSGIRIVEIAGGYQMLSSPGYASYIRDFYKTKHKEKLSKPALETLAIVAYKQPVTRTDVELIRGVNSDGVIAHLLSKELVKPVGRKDVPGRPFLYGTTKQFMEYFGLKSLDDLPKLEEFPTLTPAAEMETGETGPAGPAPVEEASSSQEPAEHAAVENTGEQLQEVQENNAQQSA